MSTLSNIHLSVSSAKKFWAPEGGYGGEGRKGERMYPEDPTSPGGKFSPNLEAHTQAKAKHTQAEAEKKREMYELTKGFNEFLNEIILTSAREVENGLNTIESVVENVTRLIIDKAREIIKGIKSLELPDFEEYLKSNSPLLYVINRRISDVKLEELLHSLIMTTIERAITANTTKGEIHPMTPAWLESRDATVDVVNEKRIFLIREFDKFLENLISESAKRVINGAYMPIVVKEATRLVVDKAEETIKGIKS